MKKAIRLICPLTSIIAVSRLVAANPATFDALQTAGQLEWLGCSATGEAVSEMLETGRINPQFADWAERRVRN